MPWTDVANKTAHAIDAAAKTAGHGVSDAVKTAARIVAKAHLGDINAGKFINDMVHGAAQGIQAARNAADTLAKGAIFLAHHVDLPKILADAIPIPAVRSIAQNVIGFIDPIGKFADAVDALLAWRHAQAQVHAGGSHERRCASRRSRRAEGAARAGGARSRRDASVSGSGGTRASVGLTTARGARSWRECSDELELEQAARHGGVDSRSCRGLTRGRKSALFMPSDRSSDSGASASCTISSRPRPTR